MKSKKILRGKLRGNERGYAFLINDDPGIEDYFISHSDLKGAMHGDSVIAEAISGSGERTAARVLKITGRGIDKVVGTYFERKGGGIVVPDDRKYFCDVFVPFGKGGNAHSGDKVICRILSYPDDKKRPEGTVTDILGRQFDRKAELKSIEASYGLDYEFSPAAIKEAERAEVREEDITGRKDFRKITAFTIDGEDARDFDDAVSIEKAGGKFRLGVHIADVSEYVKAGSALDREAFTRGTSVYFPEKVIPMLPEKLCNDVCSLVEGKDRLTLSCVMTLDKKGNVLKSEITRSVINSSARLTYGEVQKILDGDKAAAKRRKDLLKSIGLMEKLAGVLAAKRAARGSIDLEIGESAIIVNDGKIEISPAPRDKAHGIIEEFMILANVVVAEKMFNASVPFVYRVHDKPSEEKINTLYDFIDGLGIKAARPEDPKAKDYRNILAAAEGENYFTIVNRVMLRSMQKARYSPKETGHFGLNEKFYCHFTSPIRRYPDLIVHRIIKDYLSGKKDLREKYATKAEEAAKRASETEKNAAEAERAVDDYYKTLYISDRIGEIFDGVISGVTGFGIFVELECGVEGLVPIETISGERAIFDEKNFLLKIGRKSFKLGDAVKIKVVGANLGARRAEFNLV